MSKLVPPHGSTKLKPLLLEGQALADEKKKAEGMSTPEALRCLKRRLARIVYNHLITEQTASTTPTPAAA